VLNRFNEIAQNKELDAIINDKEKLLEFIEGRDLADLLTAFPAAELKGANTRRMSPQTSDPSLLNRFKLKGTRRRSAFNRWGCALRQPRART
jgi:hypothetical protein